ncbi:MAG: DUF1152 domain-containing protein, partial [Candidatus Omnitrophica bacterium]|nr:DUF1152 domain-containing protein [Candidatus Omnitrophota bacterium]
MNPQAEKERFRSTGRGALFWNRVAKDYTEEEIIPKYDKEKRTFSVTLNIPVEKHGSIDMNNILPGIIHDINNPASVIANNANFLSLDLRFPPEARESFSNLNSKIATEMNKNLMQLSDEFYCFTSRIYQKELLREAGLEKIKEKRRILYKSEGEDSIKQQPGNCLKAEEDALRLLAEIAAVKSVNEGLIGAGKENGSVIATRIIRWMAGSLSRAYHQIKIIISKGRLEQLYRLSAQEFIRADLSEEQGSLVYLSLDGIRVATGEPKERKKGYTTAISARAFKEEVGLSPDVYMNNIAFYSPTPITVNLGNIFNGTQICQKELKSLLIEIAEANSLIFSFIKFCLGKKLRQNFSSFLTAISHFLWWSIWRRMMVVHILRRDRHQNFVNTLRNIRVKVKSFTGGDVILRIYCGLTRGHIYMGLSGKRETDLVSMALNTIGRKGSRMKAVFASRRAENDLTNLLKFSNDEKEALKKSKFSFYLPLILNGKKEFIPSELAPLGSLFAVALIKNNLWRMKGVSTLRGGRVGVKTLSIKSGRVEMVTTTYRTLKPPMKASSPSTEFILSEVEGLRTSFSRSGVSSLFEKRCPFPLSSSSLVGREIKEIFVGTEEAVMKDGRVVVPKGIMGLLWQEQELFLQVNQRAGVSFLNDIGQKKELTARQDISSSPAKSVNSELSIVSPYLFKRSRIRDKKGVREVISMGPCYSFVGEDKIMVKTIANEHIYTFGFPQERVTIKGQETIERRLLLLHKDREVAEIRGEDNLEGKGITIKGGRVIPDYRNIKLGFNLGFVAFSLYLKYMTDAQKIELSRIVFDPPLDRDIPVVASLVMLERFWFRLEKESKRALIRAIKKGQKIEIAWGGAKKDEPYLNVYLGGEDQGPMPVFVKGEGDRSRKEKYIYEELITNREKLLKFIRKGKAFIRGRYVLYDEGAESLRQYLDFLPALPPFLLRVSSANTVHLSRSSPVQSIIRYSSSPNLPLRNNGLTLLTPTRWRCEAINHKLETVSSPVKKGVCPYLKNEAKKEELILWRPSEGRIIGHSKGDKEYPIYKPYLEKADSIDRAIKRRKGWLSTKERIQMIFEDFWKVTHNYLGKGAKAAELFNFNQAALPLFMLHRVGRKGRIYLLDAHANEYKFVEHLGWMVEGLKDDRAPADDNYIKRYEERYFQSSPELLNWLFKKDEKFAKKIISDYSTAKEIGFIYYERVSKFLDKLRIIVEEQRIPPFPGYIKTEGLNGIFIHKGMWYVGLGFIIEKLLIAIDEKLKVGGYLAFCEEGMEQVCLEYYGLDIWRRYRRIENHELNFPESWMILKKEKSAASPVGKNQFHISRSDPTNLYFLPLSKWKEKKEIDIELVENLSVFLKDKLGLGSSLSMDADNLLVLSALKSIFMKDYSWTEEETPERFACLISNVGEIVRHNLGLLEKKMKARGIDSLFYGFEKILYNFMPSTMVSVLVSRFINSEGGEDSLEGVINYQLSPFDFDDLGIASILDVNIFELTQLIKEGRFTNDSKFALAFLAHEICHTILMHFSDWLKDNPIIKGEFISLDRIPDPKGVLGRREEVFKYVVDVLNEVIAAKFVLEIVGLKGVRELHRYIIEEYCEYIRGHLKRGKGLDLGKLCQEECLPALAEHIAYLEAVALQLELPKTETLGYLVGLVKGEDKYYYQAVVDYYTEFWNQLRIIKESINLEKRLFSSVTGNTLGKNAAGFNVTAREWIREENSRENGVRSREAKRKLEEMGLGFEIGNGSSPMAESRLSVNSPVDGKNTKSELFHSSQVSEGIFTGIDYLKKIFAFNLPDEVDIVTMGGGGDILGGIFLACQLRKIFEESGRFSIKFRVFTTNLKRGAENPQGGPVPMSTLKSRLNGEIGSIMPLAPSKHFYPLKDGLFVQANIKDEEGKIIKGYQSEVRISEGSILGITEDLGIVLIMADASQSGTNLARDYLQSRGKNNKQVLVIGLDMGGDVLARFPVRKNSSQDHPEKDVRSPNTDAVFLDMLSVIESKIKNNPFINVVMAVSALGGDGELGETLLGYLKEHYQENNILGILDNIELIKQYLPNGGKYIFHIKELMALIPSEVSGNFIARILMSSHISLGHLQKKYEDKTNGWNDCYWSKDSLFIPKDVWDIGKMSAELQEEGLSRKTIRNGTRMEVLPFLYPCTIFLSPEAVSVKICIKQQDFKKLNWYEKDRLFQKLHYITEMSDPNNEKDRAVTNRYLIKSGILELAVQKSEDKRQGFVRSEIHRLKSKYSLAKDVIFELSRLSHIWDISFSDKLEIAISNLSFSESKEKKDEYLTKLKRWQRDYEEGKIFKNFATFYYIIQYTFLPLSEMAARFDINKDEKIDGFIKVLDEQTQFIQNLHKQIGNISYSDIFIYAILEHIIPSIAGNTKTFKAYADKLKVLQEFIFRITYLNNYSYVCSLLEDSVPLVAAKISKVDLFREVLGELNKFLEIGGKLTAAESYLGKARIVEDILPIMINLFEG